MRRSLVGRFWSKVARAGADQCWEWLDNKTRGYGRIWIGGRGPGRGLAMLAHRIAWELTNGPPPEGMVVMHRCDNPGCCNPAHLALGIQADNVADMVAKRRQQRGSRSGRTSLTEADVLKIRELAATGKLQKDIRAAYRIGSATISNIVTGQSWKHV